MSSTDLAEQLLQGWACAYCTLDASGIDPDCRCECALCGERVAPGTFRACSCDGPCVEDVCGERVVGGLSAEAEQRILDVYPAPRNQDDS